jgi:predicted nucleic acid-binding protein
VILVDTNVLVRRAEPAHPDHAAAIEAVARLRLDGEILCVTPQIIAEFWTVATRPLANNGLALVVAEVLAEVERIERLFRLLPDLPELYEAWKGIVIEHGVVGTRVHDARIAAAMRVHGVERLLTFNTRDFARAGASTLSAVPKNLMISHRSVHAVNTAATGKPIV